MKLFTAAFEVGPADIDELGHVNNIVYLRWVQEIATRHWFAVALPEWTERYVWVVTRHEIDYRAQIKLGDTVRAETQVGVLDGLRFPRFVRIYANERLAAEAVTLWVLLETPSMKPRRVRPEMIAAFT